MPKYNCDFCNYVTKLKGDYVKHLKTKKHLNNEEKHGLILKSLNKMSKNEQNEQNDEQNSQKVMKFPQKVMKFPQKVMNSRCP